MRPATAGAFGPDASTQDDTDRAARPFIPAPTEDVTDEKTGEIIERDPRSAPERDLHPYQGSAAQVILDEGLRAEAEAAGLVPVLPQADIDAAVAAQAGKKLTRRGRLARMLTQQALALRAQGYTVGEVAQHLRVSPGTITGWLRTHRHDLATLDLDRQLDEIAVPLANENLIHGLIAGDKQYTLEVLKGRGKLKRPKEGDDDAPRELPVLRVVVSAGGQANILVAPSGQTLDQMAHGGKVVGTAATPKSIAIEASEGEVVGVSSEAKEISHA